MKNKIYLLVILNITFIIIALFTMSSCQKAIAVKSMDEQIIAKCPNIYEYYFFDKFGNLLKDASYSYIDGKMVKNEYPSEDSLPRHFAYTPELYPKLTSNIMDFPKEVEEIHKSVSKIKNKPKELENLLTTCEIDVRTIYNPNGKLIYVKAIQGNTNGGWSTDIRYGFDKKAEEIVRKNVKYRTYLVNPKGIPAYQCENIRLQFGNYDVYRAKNPMVEQIMNKDDKKNWDLMTHTVKFDSLEKFIEKNLKYPSSAVYNRISGTVYVSFIINNKGRIRDIKVTDGFNKEFDREALRVISLINDYNYDIGYANNDEIRIPISFTFDKKPQSIIPTKISKKV